MLREVRLLHAPPFGSRFKSETGQPPNYLSPTQAAGELGVTRQTVYNWVTSGKLPAKQIGRTWRIKREDLP